MGEETTEIAKSKNKILGNKMKYSFDMANDFGRRAKYSPTRPVFLSLGSFQMCVFQLPEFPS